MNHARLAIASIIAGVFVASCAGPSPRSPYAPISEAERQSGVAERLTHQAARLIQSDPVKAEQLLREALAADLYFGPAHNNLGVIYLAQSKLYEAAGEFEWSKRLMPSSADPRMNLALVLEKAGRIDEAIQSYQAALEVQAEHLPTIQALSRAQVRYQKQDEETRDHLHIIALRGDETWRAWARSELLRSDAAIPPR